MFVGKKCKEIIMMILHNYKYIDLKNVKNDHNYKKTVQYQKMDNMSDNKM